MLRKEHHDQKVQYFVQKEHKIPIILSSCYSIIYLPLRIKK